MKPFGRDPGITTGRKPHQLDFRGYNGTFPFCINRYSNKREYSLLLNSPESFCVGLTSNVEMQVRQIHVGKIAMVLTPQTTYGHAGTDTSIDEHARCDFIIIYQFRLSRLSVI